MAPVRPEPGFDLYAPIVPQARRGHRLAWVGIALLFAIAAGLVFATFLHLDRPSVSEMRGTIHEAWVPMMAPNERDFVIVEIEGHR